MSKSFIQTIFRTEVLSRLTYKSTYAHNFIKLDAMENPYTWPKSIKTEWLNSIKNCHINRYPDSEAKQLIAILRKANQIPISSKILLGNGSDEIIQILLMALPNKANVLSPSPGFVMYQHIALSLGLNYQSIPLQNSFELDLQAMLESIKQHQPAIIFLAYPNNPTGNLFNTQAVEQIINATTGLVIIDEAYAPFAQASFISRLPDYRNLLVMRTLSKLGLAGIRLGFIAGNNEVISQLNKIRLPYNISSLTQHTAIFCLEKPDLFKPQIRQICIDRFKVLEQLQKLKGITAFNSAANFILFKTNKNQATEIFEALKARGILIKNVSTAGGLLTDCLRVTIGKAEENKLFIESLAAIIADQKNKPLK